MEATNIGVLPYREITTSGAAILFISYGLPIITSKLQSTQETFNEDFCLLFTPNNAQSLKDSILASLQKEELFQSEKQKILAFAHRFNWQEIAEHTINIYKSV
jgi:glycosyltransferase involved in cell wall biosynthesis